MRIAGTFWMNTLAPSTFGELRPQLAHDLVGRLALA